MQIMQQNQAENGLQIIKSTTDNNALLAYAITYFGQAKNCWASKIH